MKLSKALSSDRKRNLAEVLRKLLKEGEKERFKTRNAN